MTGWVIHTTMRRRWPDGTEFVIRAAGDDETRILSATNGYHLTVTHPAGLKAHSHHQTVEAAKAHAEELMDSFPEAAPPSKRRPSGLFRPVFGADR